MLGVSERMGIKLFGRETRSALASRGKNKQESLAIAKTTARCVIYIAALKILESP